jgi:hypothetical protein
MKSYDKFCSMTAGLTKTGEMGEIVAVATL